jgi:hypothetical protein
LVKVMNTANARLHAKKISEQKESGVEYKTGVEQLIKKNCVI